MDERQEILQILFENYVLIGSDCELATLLGYGKNSRSTIMRIKRGESVSADKIAAIWARLRQELGLSDGNIAAVAEYVHFGKNVYSVLRDAYGSGDEWHDETCAILLTEQYSLLPESIEEDFITGLKEIKLQRPELYFGMIAYHYMLCKNISPYTKKGKKALAWQLHAMNEQLRELFPANSRAYEAAKKANSINIADEHLTVLKLIENLKVIIRNYVDEHYFENFLREMGHLLDVGDDSFWVVPGTTFSEGCELWYFSVIETKSEQRGAYIAMRLRAASNAIDSFKLAEGYNFMFLRDEENDNLQLMQACNLATGKIEFAGYGYDYDKRELELLFDDSLEQTFCLPQLLHCIDYQKPEGKDEKVWANIVKRLLDNKCAHFLLSAVNSSSGSDIEYLADYEVTNVCIDRKQLTVTFVDDEDATHSYSIAVDTYPFFLQLTPHEFASVVRIKSSGEYGICWNHIGQHVLLKEFKETRE